MRRPGRSTVIRRAGAEVIRDGGHPDAFLLEAHRPAVDVVDQLGVELRFRVR